MTPNDQAELARCFDYHAPGPDDRVKYEALTVRFKDMAALIFELCPFGEDRTVALRLLSAARMTANASIACKYPPRPVDE